MIKEIATSMVESIALLSFRFNGIAPNFHPEAFDVRREGDGLLLSPRYSRSVNSVPVRKIESVLQSLCGAEPVEQSTSTQERTFICRWPPSLWGVRLKVRLRNGSLIAVDSFSGMRPFSLLGTPWTYHVRAPTSNFFARIDNLRPALEELFPDATIFSQRRSPREQEQYEEEQHRRALRNAEYYMVQPVAARATEVDEPLFHLDTASDPAERLATVLAAGANINAGDRRGRTPLAHAIRYDKPWLVAPLLEAGADPNIPDHDGETVLRLACRRGKSEADLAIIKQLVDAGADVNTCVDLLFARPYSDSPFHSALTELMMASGVDVDTRDRSGLTGLMRSAGSLARYIEAGADVNARTDDGKTALMYATRCVESLRLLVDAGVSVNAKDRDGRTALVHATRAYSVNPNVIRFLMNAGADVSISDKDGKTARDYASYNERAQRVEYDVRVEFGYPRREPALYSRAAIDRAVEVCRLLGASVTPPRQIEAAFPDPQWIATLEAESSRLRESPHARQKKLRREIRAASPEWSGRIRSCPRCQTSFKSVHNKGQCPNCSLVFFASHPGLGDARCWTNQVKGALPPDEQGD
jgi:ankyrin repeat protein